MKNTNEIRIGAILSYVNLAIGCIIPLFYTPVMLRLLCQGEYGVYALSNSVISYLSLLNLGVGSAVIRYITKYRAEDRIEDVRRIFGLFAVIYACLSVLVLAGGGVLISLSGSLFGRGLTADEIKTLQKLLVVMSVSTAISFPLGLFSSVTIVYERYLFNKLVAIAETVLLPVLNLIVLFFGQGAVGLAVLGMMMQLMNGVIFACYCKKKLDVYPVFRNMPVGILKELVVFCAFVFLSSVVDLLYWATDKVLIGAIIGSVAVAVYNVGGTFTSMLQSMAHAISGVFAPRVNMMVAKNEDMEKLSALLIRVGRLQYLVVSLVLSGYVVFGRKFVILWAGEEYVDAYYVGMLTMIPLVVPLIQNIAFTTIIAQNKHRFRSIIYALIAVVNVVSTYLVLPRYGIIGAAVCTAVAFVLGQGIIMNIYYYRVTRLDIPAFWKNIGRMSIVPSTMIVVFGMILRYICHIASIWELAAGICVYTLCFAILTWFVSMNRYEKDLLGGMLKRVAPTTRKN